MLSLSIIIPTYNNFELLKRCISSIEGQLCNNDEIIIIDDGSVDETERYFSKYSSVENIRYIKQKNSGSGAARNNGLKNSNGNYVWFIDADDYIDSKSISKIRQKLGYSNTDILFFSYAQINSNSTTEYIINYDINDMNQLLVTNHFPWNKIFKKELFKGICFPEEKIRFQDHATIPKLLIRANNFDFMKDILYFYDFSHENNISKNIKKDTDIFKACDYLIDFFKKDSNKELELILIKTMLFDRLFVSKKNKLKSKEIDMIYTYLQHNIPNWRNSYYLESEFTKTINHLVPKLSSKLFVINAFKRSKYIALFLISTISILKQIRKSN